MSSNAIPFYQEEIEKKESLISVPYCGFFSPQGQLIDFNTLFGGKHHEEWKNPLGYAFIKYISYMEEGFDVHSEDWRKEYKPNAVSMKQVEGYDNLIFRGCGYYGQYDWFESFENILDCLQKDIASMEKKIELHRYDEYDRFKLDLLRFFRNAYTDKDFFKNIGRVITIENREKMFEKVKKRYYPSYCDENKHLIIGECKRDALMAYFKDICVMYLGYDALEAYKPNGDAIEAKHFAETNFLANPRVITSSSLNINERFFNYLIMGWAIHQIPKYVFDKEKGRYVQLSELLGYHNTSENEFKEEIEKIKKHVPINERYKYFI